MDLRSSEIFQCFDHSFWTINFQENKALTKYQDILKGSKKQMVSMGTEVEQRSEEQYQGWQVVIIF